MASHAFYNRPRYSSHSPTALSPNPHSPTALSPNPHSTSSLKPSVQPSYAVFPDSLPTLAAPPLIITTEPGEDSPPATPTHTPDTYDYFDWTAQQTPPNDISTPAPVGAIADDRPPNLSSLPLGAWYSFARGLNTPVGTSLFPDEQTIPTRRPRLRRQAHHYHQHRNTTCTYPCAYCSRCHSSRSSASSSQVAGAYSASSPSNQSASDSDDACDHDAWDCEITPCFVESLRRRPPPSLPNPSSMHTTGLDEVSVEQVANGADVQGIPWDTLPYSRTDYRAMRAADHTRNRDVMEFTEGLKYLLKDPRRGAQFYDFFTNSRAVKCSIVHFQLRNLAWATSMNDVYVMHDASIVHWDAACKRRTQVMDLSGSDPSMVSGLGVVQISTMIANDDLIIAGGFYGEVVAMNLHNGTIIHNKRITYDDNAITNAIDIFDNTIMASNNDCFVRCFDMHTFQPKSSFSFGKPVNHATRQPGGKMVAVAGDDHPILVIDGDSGERISQLRGHGHYSFATAWHPNGRMFATGSQDHTCRVWDVRNMSQSLTVLGAHMGAVRSLRFSSCGRFMVMAEPRDYVHIFDINGGEFDTCQEIDLFGEIAGIALTPNAEGLYVAVSDRMYSSLIEYERRSTSKLCDSIF